MSWPAICFPPLARLRAPFGRQRTARWIAKDFWGVKRGWEEWELSSIVCREECSWNLGERGHPARPDRLPTGQPACMPGKNRALGQIHRLRLAGKMPARTGRMPALPQSASQKFLLKGATNPNGWIRLSRRKSGPEYSAKSQKRPERKSRRRRRWSQGCRSNGREFRLRGCLWGPCRRRSAPRRP